MVPFSYGVEDIRRHVQDYLANWQHGMDQVVFTGREVNAPTPFDRSNFFLDDNLPYKNIEISDGIFGDYLLTEISPSRRQQPNDWMVNQSYHQLSTTFIITCAG
jgi:hypothetical protein